MRQLTSFAGRLPALSIILGLAGISAPVLAPAAQADIAASAQETTARIEERPCPFPVPPGEIVQCMTAWLPLFHEAQAAPQADRLEEVGVGLVLLGNFTRRENPDPVVYLAGGPGQAGSDALAAFANALEIRRNRGILLVDQRGTGTSQPRLDCPGTFVNELDDYRLNDPSLDPQDSVVARAHECHERLVGEGIDLSAFNTRATAHDLKAIRKAFGLPQWNLIGTSYGTRVALDAMRVDPHGIRSVVLNSTLPVASGFDAVAIRSRRETLSAMLANCAADEGCNAAFPELRKDLETIASHLDSGPLRLYLRDSQSNELTQVNVDWNDVIGALEQHLAFLPSAVAVPRYIHELAMVVRGRANLNQDEVMRIFRPDLGDIGDQLAMGMHLSVRCREDLSGLDEISIATEYENASFYHPRRDAFSFYRRICAFWDAGTEDTDFGAPVKSDIPVLMLAGDVDPLTPLPWSLAVKKTLSNAHLVTFRGMAHDVFDFSPCARAITANFLDEPEGDLDTSCAAAMAPAFGLEQN